MTSIGFSPQMSVYSGRINNFLNQATTGALTNIRNTLADVAGRLGHADSSLRAMTQGAGMPVRGGYMPAPSFAAHSAIMSSFGLGPMTTSMTGFGGFGAAGGPFAGHPFMQAPGMWAGGCMNQFPCGPRPFGGLQGLMQGFQHVKSALDNLNRQMQGYMANLAGAQTGAMTGSYGAQQAPRPQSTPASFPPAKGSGFIDALRKGKGAARKLNVSGRRDVQRINQAVGQLRGASATVSAASAKRAGKQNLQLSAADVTAIKNAPNLAAAKEQVRNAVIRQTGVNFPPINMNNRGGIKNTKSRQALNRLLKTKIRAGLEKNSGSSLIMDSILESTAKSVRQGHFGTSQVTQSFAFGQVGTGFCGSYGMFASGTQMASVQNPAESANVDLSGYLGAAKSVSELYSPLIFDLEGLGLKVKNGGLIEVDLDGDGKTEMISDLDAHQGLLVFDSKIEVDLDEDYAVGADLFGNGTDMSQYGIVGPKDDGTFENGFDALRALCEHFEVVHGDKQHLDAADLALLEDACGLRMRVGGIENGEERRFADVGITRINLGRADAIQRLSEAEEDRYGNRLMRQEGATFIVDDNERDYVDIWFNIQARAVDDKETSANAELA